MLKKLITYFTRHHMLTNFMLIGILLGGVFFWHTTNKEEMPNFAADFLRVNVSFPGVSASDVEYFVTNPLEEAINGLEGVSSITSSSGTGRSSISIELEVTPRERSEVINNIKSTVLNVNLPSDIRDEPSFREFKSSQKAIIDIFLYNDKAHLLNKNQRRELQKYIRALENQLIGLKTVSSVSVSGYLNDEIQIQIDPEKSKKYQISLAQIASEIKKNHIYTPVGSLEDSDESKITVKAELDQIKELQNLVIQGSFSGRSIRLKKIATIIRDFESSNTISKVNGHEAIAINVVKTSNSGILKAIEEVNATLKKFEQYQLKGTDIKLVTLDDESYSVRNRISLVISNGLIGFVLILTILFIFLNFRSGLWVAMGIPFTICFTMVTGALLGFTINNITLSAVIVVMGMVVDDAIVVAENITRLKHDGLSTEKAAIEGTTFVFLPIVASILTTCLAFVPLLFFHGHMARIIYAMPLIIFMMLGASLLESTLILPGHMNLHLPKWLKRKKNSKLKEDQPHWFYAVENFYGFILNKILKVKLLVFLLFLGLFLISFNLYKNNFKFVMFPNEETTEIRLTAEVGQKANRYQTAKKTREIEAILKKYLGKEIVGYRTEIARSRRGGDDSENRFRMRIEIVPRDKRNKSTKQLITLWQKDIKKLSGFNKLRISTQRFGRSSGSPIEIFIEENDDSIRKKIAQSTLEFLEKLPDLKNAEIDRPRITNEFIIDFDREYLKKINLSPESISSTLKYVLQGSILYTLKQNNEEIDVKLTSPPSTRKDIRSLEIIPIENNQKYLVPLKNLIKIKKMSVSSAIEHANLKRITKVYADMKPNTNRTPLEIAEYTESTLFPELFSKYPSSTIYFSGEVADSRESGSNFLFGAIMVLLLIYVILALLFDSLVLPFIIMLSIPFGVIGVIFAYYFHGIQNFGFFTIIGLLGLAGVVVNDSIVMVSKLRKEQQKTKKKILSANQIAEIAKTRLRAVILTTLTTVAGLFPTAYGIAGYDSMLAEMMLAMGWGLLFATMITLILIPSLYCALNQIKGFFIGRKK